MNAPTPSETGSTTRNAPAGITKVPVCLIDVMAVGCELSSARMGNVQ